MPSVEGMHTAFLMVIAYCGIKAVDQVFILGWRKAFGTRYVTEAECENRRSKCSALESAARLEKEVRELKRIIVRHMLLNRELTEDQKKELEKMVV